MADQPKKKNPNSITRNDKRRNGKASKQSPTALRRPGKSYRGSHTQGVELTYLQKTLLGGGAMVYARALNKRMLREHPDKRRGHVPG